MTIAPGLTVEEVRDFVYEYERQPHGSKRAWLAVQGVSWGRFRRWRDTVYDGSVDRGLIPRQGSVMTSPSQRRHSAKQNAMQEAENERLRARVQELEATNEALGKAIGLVHQLSEQEPGPSQTNEPSSSS